MSLSGARGLIRISRNRACARQTGMVIEGVSEKDFYLRVTGEEYQKEFGERPSARARGAKFESNLTQNDAALLRRALAPLYGLDPDMLVVRNFADEVPGPPSSMRAVRFTRTRRILRNLAAGLEVPHLLIQPQLRLPTGRGSRDFVYISPDCMVLDPQRGIYVPVEEKSFIVRNNVADGADLDNTRRQAAVQILALRAETAAFGLDAQVSNRAAFVFASPYGLSPVPAKEEQLDGEVREIAQAIEALVAMRTRFEELKAREGTSFPNLFWDLPANYQESCIGSCVFASKCQEERAGQPAELGDAAVELFGTDADLDRLTALLLGAEPTTSEEVGITAALKTASAALGWKVA